MYVPRGLAMANPTKAISQLTLGDVKQSFLTVDHDGWILLNGRAKTSLTSAQQAVMTALGWGVLPDSRDRILVGAGVKPLGSSGGSYSISQSNLPNVTLTGSASYKPAGTNAVNGTYVPSTAQGQRGYQLPAEGGSGYYAPASQYSFGFSLMTATFTGTTATITTSNISLNGNVTQTEFTQPYLAINTFVYLGT